MLRLKVGINEAVTTRLLNYIALDLMLFLIYDKWKDVNGSGQLGTSGLAVGREVEARGRCMQRRRSPPVTRHDRTWNPLPALRP